MVVAEDLTKAATAPDVASNGRYFGIVFVRDWLWFALVDSEGQQVGDAIPIEGGALAEFPDITWAGDRFLISWQMYDQASNYQLHAAAVTL